MSAPRDRAIARRPAALSGRERYERFLEADLRRSLAMAPEQAVSAAHVAGTILKELDRLNGNEGNWTVEAEPIRARESWVFKAHTPLAPWPLAVKVYCEAVPAEDITVQAEHLRSYDKRMAGCPDLAVPAFWASLPEHRTLVMQWIDAPRMDELLRRAGRGDERPQLFTAAGRWLRHYHSRSEAIVRPLRAKSYPRHIDMLLGGEEGAGRHLRDSVFRQGYEVLVEHVEVFAKYRLAHVMAHGDFVPHNVFHGGGRTIGFDMVPRIRPALSDICHFLVHAELRKPFALRRARLGPTGLERQDVQAFFDAYGSAEYSGTEPVISYMQLNEALLRWAVVISHHRRGVRLRREHLLAWARYRRMARRAAVALQQGQGLVS